VLVKGLELGFLWGDVMFGKSRPTPDEIREKLCSLLLDEDSNAAFVKAFQGEGKAEEQAFFSRFCLLEWLSLFNFQNKRRDVRFFDLFVSIGENSPLAEQAFPLNAFFISDHERCEATKDLTESSTPFPIPNPVPLKKLIAIALRIRNTAYNRRAKEAIETRDLTVLQFGLRQEVRLQLGCAGTQFSLITDDERAQISCIYHEFASMELLMERP